MHIDRLPKPDILVRKEMEWTEKFLASDNKRPDNSKYGHKEIKAQLNSMSFHKCFYCETKLKGVSSEIDHHIEIVDPNGRELAFKWENLYLSCGNCNKKVPNTTIPVNEVLDPCLNTDEDIQEQLFFENEIITVKNDSKIGLQTIKKFRLDTDLLDHLRLKQLSLFNDVLLQIKENQVNSGRKRITSEERESLIRFSQADHPFSLMFKLLLKKYYLIK